MADAKKRKQLKTFPGLAASRFQHPHDVAATETLAGIPGLDLVVSKVMEYAWRTHPFPILRAKELDAWHATGYRDLTETRALPP
jgi:hypothetical protein